MNACKRARKLTAAAAKAALADASALVAGVQIALGLAVNAAVAVHELCEAGWALALMELDCVQRLSCLGSVLWHIGDSIQESLETACHSSEVPLNTRWREHGRHKLLQLSADIP